MQLMVCQDHAVREEDGDPFPAAVVLGKQILKDGSVPVSSHQPVSAGSHDSGRCEGSNSSSCPTSDPSTLAWCVSTEFL